MWLHQHAGVDGHVVHALLGLLFDDFEHHLLVEVFTRRTRESAS